MSAYLEPTMSSGAVLLQRGIRGPVTMLNLLRFRDWADYSDHPELAPPRPISGEAAYDLYVAATLPHLRASGGALVLLGRGGPFLIGPEDEIWHAAMLVRQASIDALLAFAADDAYLEGLGHRIAALEDSRLLPLEERMAA